MIATQNPLEQVGTSALPESQLDRFMMRISMGYPSRSAELEIFSGESRQKLLGEQINMISSEQFIQYQRSAEAITVSKHVLIYLYELLLFTRQSDLFVNGISTRGGLAVLHAAKSWAWLEGSEALMPEHIQAVFPFVAGHRLQAKEGGGYYESAGQQVIDSVAIPR